MTIDAVRNSYMYMMKETRGMDRQPFLSSHFQFKKIILTRSIAQTTTIIFTSKTGFLLFNQTIPPFLPIFRPIFGFPGCLCSCTVLRKRKKSGNRDFSKKPMNKGFFTYSYHRVNIPVTYPHFDTR